MLFPRHTVRILCIFVLTVWSIKAVQYVLLEEFHLSSRVLETCCQTVTLFDAILRTIAIRIEMSTWDTQTRVPVVVGAACWFKSQRPLIFGVLLCQTPDQSLPSFPLLNNWRLNSIVMQFVAKGYAMKWMTLGTVLYYFTDKNHPNLSHWTGKGQTHQTSTRHLKGKGRTRLRSRTKHGNGTTLFWEGRRRLSRLSVMRPHSQLDPIHERSLVSPASSCLCCYCWDEDMSLSVVFGI